MTGTAAFLGWIDPSLPLRPDTVLAEQLLPLTRSLVTDDVAVDARQWRRVEVVSDPGLAGSGPLLTASPDRADWHFHVDEYGRPSRSRRWRVQQPCLEQPNVVRIQVARLDGDAAVSQTQWLCVEGLLAALNEVAAAGGGALPFHVRGG
jgi:hypothetical protein